MPNDTSFPCIPSIYIYIQMNACFPIFCLKVKGNIILEKGPKKQGMHTKQKATRFFLGTAAFPSKKSEVMNASMEKDKIPIQNA